MYTNKGLNVVSNGSFILSGALLSFNCSFSVGPTLRVSDKIEVLKRADTQNTSVNVSTEYVLYNIELQPVGLIFTERNLEI